jgi:predicted RNase H-like HicB family nuclease
MKYAVIFEQGASSVGVTVPDLPGCFAVAPNLAEARTLIAEAIAFHIEACVKMACRCRNQRCTLKISTSPHER